MAGSTLEVETARRHTVFQGASVHTAHCGSMAEVLQQTRNLTGFEELLDHFGCPLAQTGDQSVHPTAAWTETLQQRTPAPSQRGLV